MKRRSSEIFTTSPDKTFSTDRVDGHTGAQSEDEWNARLGQGGDHHKHIVPGGAWWIQVERWKSNIAAVAPSPEIQALIEKQDKEFEKFAAGMQALGGSGRRETAERRQYRKQANHDATVCAKCGRTLGADEPIVRDLFTIGTGILGGYRTILEVRCLDCGTNHKEHGHTSRKCLTCGRIVYQHPRGGRFRTFCCTLHQRRYYRTR